WRRFSRTGFSASKAAQGARLTDAPGAVPEVPQVGALRLLNAVSHAAVPLWRRLLPVPNRAVPAPSPVPARSSLAMVRKGAPVRAPSRLPLTPLRAHCPEHLAATPSGALRTGIAV